MKRVLLYGSSPAKYHPVDNAEGCLRSLLGNTGLDVTDAPAVFTEKKLAEYAYLVLYPEFGQPELTDAQTGALLSYVGKGGCALVIHNGISLHSRSELCQMIGAAFFGHPPYDTLPRIQYRVEAPEHPLLAGVTDFEMGDEPYQLRLDPFASVQLLLSYTYNGQSVPAAWVRTFGQGRVAYCACGHDAEGFRHPMFVCLLKNITDSFSREK